ncbi:hypothetical protein IAQ61_007241 [Plenodomus lingam]|uniref:Uncharacterized protein n=1 Tax=Leptosphaeria maculans (strain JN3 / isolate v23.1.3 / race Av1-4-5-6-7-8) TaxID=985895 RepID=E5A178_LEPMJ|nr:hypothetical protein LEMA_P104730.1 [Plenodomus lingam JN3]KAH9867936.1 hypothetical protein IAQ61_007241 [Plenodomus lingam]CBX97342.1 hypothetical protein LEMA_P104730.1 [Plenodomus lingam JN3]
MKRKFSFNLAPVKIVSKTEPVAATPQSKPTEPTPPPSASHSHKTHASRDSICDNSPFICRRPLDAHTEQELRLACRAILQNFKPSDHGMEDTDPKLDFGGLQRRQESKSRATEVRVRAPMGVPADLQKTSSLHRSKTRTRAKADLEIKARTQQSELPVRANSSRRRGDFAWLDERDDKREEKLKTYGKPSIDMPRSGVALYDSSNEDITLPVTVPSTLANAKVSSAAANSATRPGGKSSNRRSQSEDPAAIADAQASEWMAKELEKKRRQEASQPQARPSTAVNPPSRSKSIKENIKGYVFPGNRSRAISRAQSKESLRQAEGGDDQDLQRSGSWRKWTMPRRSSSKSRPGTSAGPTEDGDQSARPDSGQVNLNRELPPLPGLDQWKEPAAATEDKAASSKPPIPESHIANMMRPQDAVPDRSPATHKQHRKSGSDTLLTQYANAHPPRGSSRHLQDTAQSPRRAPPPGPDTTHSLISSLSSSTHTRHRSGDSLTTPGTASLDAGPLSRKSSVDVTSALHPTHTHTVSVSVAAEPKSASKKDEQRSRLKKVFTGWMSRKEKKEDWVQSKLDKEGRGAERVLVQDGNSSAVAAATGTANATASPVVRY